MIVYDGHIEAALGTTRMSTSSSTSSKTVGPIQPLISRGNRKLPVAAERRDADFGPDYHLNE